MNIQGFRDEGEDHKNTCATASNGSLLFPAFEGGLKRKDSFRNSSRDSSFSRRTALFRSAPDRIESFGQKRVRRIAKRGVQRSDSYDRGIPFERSMQRRKDLNDSTGSFQDIRLV